MDKRSDVPMFAGCGRKRSDASMLEEAAGGVGGLSGPPEMPAGADARLWEDMLAMLLSARQDQARPLLPIILLFTFAHYHMERSRTNRTGQNTPPLRFC